MSSRPREILSVRPDRVRHRVVLCTGCRTATDPCGRCRSRLRTVAELARWRRSPRPDRSAEHRAFEAAWIAWHDR